MVDKKDLVATLTAAFNRASHARELLRQPGWLDVQAYLSKRQDDIDQAIHGAPAAASYDPGKTGMLVTLHRGRSEEVEALIKLLGRWIAEGDEAAAKLKEMGVTL